MSRPPDPTKRDADDGVARDAWLSEALRHAPDADASPPPSLSETILRQARAAASAMPATARPAASFGRRLLAAWSWLARPPVAAGFASLMVATVVGLLWWDSPLEQALPPRETPVPAAAPEPAAPTAPAAMAVPAPAPEPAPPAAAREARRQAARDAEQAKQAAEPAAALAEARRPTATESGGAAIGAAAGATADREVGVPERRLRSSPAAATTTAPAPVDAAPAFAARAPVAAQAARRDTPSAAASLGALRRAIAADPGRWRWQRDGSAAQPLTSALSEWLVQLDAAASTRRPAGRAGEPALAARSEAAADVGAPLQLWRDGRLHSTVRFDPTGVTLDSAGAPPSQQRVELTAEDAAALRAALDEATR